MTTPDEALVNSDTTELSIEQLRDQVLQYFPILSANIAIAFRWDDVSQRAVAEFILDQRRCALYQSASGMRLLVNGNKHEIGHLHPGTERLVVNRMVACYRNPRTYVTT